MSEVCVTLTVKAEVDNGVWMYVVGSCPQLGEWKARQAVAMEPVSGRKYSVYDTDNKSVWECMVSLPKNSTISFRYFIGKTVEPGSSSQLDILQDIEVIVWETNIQPRLVKTTNGQEMKLPVAEFGTYDGIHTTSNGWLENHACVQVRFHDNPIFMWKPKHRQQLYSIKCSPVDYEPGMADARSEESLNVFSEDSSLDGPPPCMKTAMVYYNLNQGQLRSSSQPATGCVYRQDDYLVFMARGMNQTHLGFQVDFYVHAKNADPHFVGSAHLLPQDKELSIFSKRVPIIGLNHRPIGEVEVEFLHIRPLPDHNWLMEVSYQNHWKWRNMGTTLNVGHRGMGSSYKSSRKRKAWKERGGPRLMSQTHESSSPVRRVTSAKENTIRSLYSAAHHGADFVELDVLLSKDNVPVIYHDFSVCLSTPLKKQSSRRMVEIAIKDLTLEQLHSMKIFHSSCEGSNDSEFIEITAESLAGNSNDDQPFPTLQSCLEQVDPQVGFNIEIKYPQVLETGENELDNFFDINHFVDRILTVVFKHAGDRKIIFSTFHADTCIMVNLKQNKYPVLFLSNGPTRRYTPYKDWRCSNFQHGISFAKAEGLLGVNFQAEGLLQDLTLIPYIHSLGLVIFVWGEDLNEEHVKLTLRKHNVDAIIFDRIGDHPEQFMIKSATPSLEAVINQGKIAADDKGFNGEGSSSSV